MTPEPFSPRAPQSLQDPDVIVVGSGHNGLVAASVLARHGFRVLVLEGHPRRPGGALGSEELTLPGFVHDVGAGFFPFARSPAFVDLDLEGLGLRIQNAPIESCHPALDGSYACIARDLDLAAAHFGSEKDGLAWRRLCGFHQSIEPNLSELLLRPFPSLVPALNLGAMNLLKVMWLFAASGRRTASRLFESEAARRVLPSLALHVDVGPDDTFGAGLGYMLGLGAATGGYGVPVGGAQQITNTILMSLERFGGRLRLGAPVKRILVRQGAAHGVELEDGERIDAKRAVFANTGAPKLFLDLIERRHVPERVFDAMRHFPRGWGTFKVDWALSGPVPWRNDQARQSAVVHAGESLDDLAHFTQTVRSGTLPERPYLVVGQHTLVDHSRAPHNQHTLYCYTRVPSHMLGGWAAHADAFADRVEQRIEGLAPAFRQKILARHITTPEGLESQNPNLVGGDLGGGSNAFDRQLLFRPLFPHFRYRMPIERLYLCSSYTHPGAGVHGMCGHNAANIAINDFG